MEVIVVVKRRLGDAQAVLGWLAEDPCAALQHVLAQDGGNPQLARR
jgi:hypothetical protein